MLDLLAKNGKLTPEEIVKSYPDDALQSVANVLWYLVDCGDLIITRDKMIRRAA